VKAHLHENVALAPLTTFGIGGPARYFIDATDEDTIRESIRFAGERDLSLFILGGGSNLLVADAGFAGLVVKVSIAGVEWERDRQRTIVRAGAGEQWDRLVASAVERGLAGIECLSGIPGSVGGTPVQNVGAYGQEVSDVLVNVRAYDRQADSIVDLSPAECQFTYRSSLFNRGGRDRYVVLKVTYALSHEATSSIRYPELQHEFDGMTAPPAIGAVRDAVRRIRGRKAMLLVEGDPDCRSAGSFFKNPILTEQQFAEIQSRTALDVPRYPASSGKVKTAAAWLIEQAGFCKGYSIGPVGLSTRHTLAVVNKGGATADDVLRLAREIRIRVFDRFGVELVEEPVLVGFARETPAKR
jgi:UDP-N-acetylmuramate dehydrogenase